MLFIAYCTMNHGNLKTLFTRKCVLRQGVQSASRNTSLPLSISGPRGEASQGVLRLGGALIPLAQRRVGLKRG